ncbi:MAG: trigger factor [Bdellovibrionales bacterium]
MKINVEELSKLERKVSVDIPVEKVNETYNQIYRSIQKQYSQPGFRKGKVPVAVIRKKFGNDVEKDALEYLIGPAYAQAVQDNNLQPVMNPNFQHESVSEGQPFSFTATFEIKPEVELKAVEGLELLKEKFEITDDRVSEVIENLRKGQAEEVVVEEDRAAANGDTAMIDFEGFIDGEALPGGKGENHPLELGADQFIPGFEEGVVGMTKGSEKEIKLTFPEDYHATDIAGKDVVFKVKLNELKTKNLPEVNDEFAAKVGEHENVDALKESIKESVGKHEENRIKDELRQRVLQKLVEGNPVEVPASLKVEQTKMLIEDAKNRMTQQGVAPADVEKHLAQDADAFGGQSEFIIKSSYLISEIASKNDIKVTPDAFNKFVMERATEIGIPPEQLMSYYNNQEARSRIDFQILEEMVTDFVISKATVTEVNKDQITK